MERKYTNPPIIEAICEFHFERDTTWNSTEPGLVFEKLRSEFPKAREVKAVGMGVSAGEESVVQKIQTTARTQFVREDDSAMVQIQPHMLAVNHLVPYPSWGRYLPLVKTGLAAYLDVAKPQGLRRVGLRYINRISFDAPVTELERYFEFRPHLGAGLKRDSGPFIVGVQRQFNDGRDFLKIEMVTVATEESEECAILLDLDFAMQKPGEIALGDVEKWIEEAHTHIIDSFEACVTDELRNKFGLIPE